MATHATIHNICEAIIRLLRSRRDTAAFAGDHLDIEVYGSASFAEPMIQVVSLLVHRFYHNGAHRYLKIRAANGGHRSSMSRAAKSVTASPSAVSRIFSLTKAPWILSANASRPVDGNRGCAYWLAGWALFGGEETDG